MLFDVRLHSLEGGGVNLNVMNYCALVAIPRNSSE